MKWEKLGRILAPDHKYEWLATFAGPSFAFTNGKDEEVRIYVTGRDHQNRSRIGMVDIVLPTRKVLAIEEQPILSLGRKGTFDQNGTGYPNIVQSDGKLFMYYVGWTPAVLVPFQNDIGLAISDDAVNFKRASEAPIVPRSNDDCLSMGSVSVMKDGALWKMWYTSFVSWGEEAHDPKHFYHIKYATSKDGINWQRDNQVAVTYSNPGEYVLGKPSVIKFNGRYHMWYCHRGEAYKMGYAQSPDGINWTRRDDLVGIECSDEGWDSQMVCYPHVFAWGDDIYMLYNGNDYGREGLGLAKLADRSVLN